MSTEVKEDGDPFAERAKLDMDIILTVSRQHEHAVDLTTNAKDAVAERNAMVLRAVDFGISRDHLADNLSVPASAINGMVAAARKAAGIEPKPRKAKG